MNSRRDVGAWYAMITISLLGLACGYVWWVTLGSSVCIPYGITWGACVGGVILIWRETR